METRYLQAVSSSHHIETADQLPINIINISKRSNFLLPKQFIACTFTRSASSAVQALQALPTAPGSTLAYYWCLQALRTIRGPAALGLQSPCKDLTVHGAGSSTISYGCYVLAGLTLCFFGLGKEDVVVADHQDHGNDHWQYILEVPVHPLRNLRTGTGVALLTITLKAHTGSANDKENKD